MSDFSVGDSVKPGFMIGTVQFGIPYGISNDKGMPTKNEIVSIITQAHDEGLRDYDTASVYGISEQILGELFHQLGIKDQVRIYTKIEPLDEDTRSSPKSSRNQIIYSLDRSLKRLGLNCVHGVLFHREEDFRYMDILIEQKKAGKCLRVGVSCSHEPEVVMSLLDSGLVDSIQLPLNLMDRRHLEARMLEKAKAKGVLRFIRSAFLQGILTMKNANIPVALKYLRPLHSLYTDLALQAGMTLKEMALRFQLNQRITSLIIGIESLEQLKEDLLYFNKGPLPEDLFKTVSQTYEHLDPLLITPSLWPSGK